MKALVWFDMLVKATSRVADVRTLANRVTCDVTTQNLGFWHYLDTRHPPDPGFYADKDELWIAGEYLRYHAEHHKAPPAALEALRGRVEDEFFIHPASQRILDLWAPQLDVLGIDGSELRRWLPLPLSVDEALEQLAELDVLLDARAMGGGAYLDFTPHGVPLRQIVSEHGEPNYVINVLRELLAVGGDYETVLLGVDADVRQDFELVSAVLRRRGVHAAIIPVARLNLPGVTGTTRTGGWEEYSLGRIADRLVPQYGVPAFRLGVRMYFALHVGLRGSCPFELHMLERFVRRAAGAVRRLDGGAPDADGLLSGLWDEARARERAFVDPNGLLQTLLKRAPDSPAARTLVKELLL